MMFTERPIQVALCGASCTGKTTLANALMQNERIAEAFPAMLPEGARELLEETGPGLADMTLKQRRSFQRRYFEWKKTAEARDGSWIADRSFVDVAAVWVERDAKDDTQLQKTLVDQCRELSLRNYTYLIHLRPGCLQFEHDGVRELDLELHSRIAHRISALLNEWQLPHLTLKTTALGDRVAEVVDEFEKLEFIPQA